MKTKNQSEAYLLSEAAQAWTHYRHMEETRTKYLAFFATVVLTSGGFFVTLMKDIDKFKPLLMTVALSVFCILLFVFSFFIWANIVRIGFVLRAYGDILDETRRHMLGFDSSAFKLWDIRSRIPPIASRGAFRIQAAATVIVQSACLALAATQAGLGVAVCWQWVAAPLWLGLLISGSALVLFVTVLYTAIRIRQAHAFHAPTPTLSPISLYQGEYEIDTPVAAGRQHASQAR